MHLNCVQLPASYLFYYKYYVGGLGINIHTYIPLKVSFRRLPQRYGVNRETVPEEE